MTRDSQYDKLDEIAESILADYRAGRTPSIESYIARNPELENEIRDLGPVLQKLEVGDEDEPAIVAPPSHAASNETAPQRLGDYKIHREVGRGGMGIVYEAEQEPLGRKVALKVLSTSIAESESIARFRREARTVALLNHDNIVPLFGFGEASGHYFFAMKFIEGTSLDRLESNEPSDPHLKPDETTALNSVEVDETSDPNATLTDVRFNPATQSRLAEESRPDEIIGSTDVHLRAGSTVVVREHSASDLRSRMDWVADVGRQAAKALAHAHGQGILHRDIKPSNIMVNELGHVWVTDFGLAKMIDADAAEASLTGSGNLVGTLRYMPPERLKGTTGPAGDIYSLGLTLYELLARRKAHPENDYAQLLRQISDPRIPSLSSVNSSIPMDLATIVEKSIALDPSQRYASAELLAADLGRFLNREPIEARRVSQLDRLRLWCRRHPAIATFLSLFVITLVAGTAVSTGFAFAAIDQRDRAQLMEKRSEQNLEMALSVLREFTMFTDEEVLSAASMQPVRKQMLESVLRYFVQFVEFNQDYPEVQIEVARAYARVGSITWLIGSQEDALNAYRSALTVFESLPEKTREHALEELEARKMLAILLRLNGRGSDSLKVATESISLCGDYIRSYPDDQDFIDQKALNLHAMALVHQEQGEFEDSLGLFHKVLTIRTDLAAVAADDIQTKVGLARAHSAVGQVLVKLRRITHAEQELSQALAMWSGIVKQTARSGHIYSLAQVQVSYGEFMSYLGRPEAAERHLRDAVSLHEKIAEHDPHMINYARGLSYAYFQLGSVLSQLEQQDEASQLFANSLDIQDHLIENNPTVNEFAVERALAHDRVAQSLWSAGEFPAARVHYVEAIKQWHAFMEKDGIRTDYPRNLAGSLANFALLLQAIGEVAEASEKFDLSIELLTNITKPDGGQSRDILIQALINSSSNQLACGHSDIALEQMQRAYDLCQDGMAGSPEDEHIRLQYSTTCYGLGKLNLQLGHQDYRRWFQEAFEIRQELISESENPDRLNKYAASLSSLGRDQDAVDTWKALLEKYPTSNEFRANIAQSYYNLGTREGMSGDSERAVELLNKSLQLRKELDEMHGGVPVDQVKIAETLSNLGNVYAFRFKKPQDAMEYFEETRRIYEHLVEVQSATGDAWVPLAGVYGNLAGQRLALGETEQALSFQNRSIEILERLRSENVVHQSLVTFLKNGYVVRSQIREKAGEFVEAAHDLHEATRVIGSAPVSVDIRIVDLFLRGDAFEAAGDHSMKSVKNKVVSVAEFERFVELLGNALARLENDEALSSAGGPSLARDLGDRAVSILEMLVEMKRFDSDEERKKFLSSDVFKPLRKLQAFRSVQDMS